MLVPKIVVDSHASRSVNGYGNVIFGEHLPMLSAPMLHEEIGRSVVTQTSVCAITEEI